MVNKLGGFLHMVDSLLSFIKKVLLPSVLEAWLFFFYLAPKLRGL